MKLMSNPCYFGCKSRVMLANGQCKYITDLEKGDWLYSENGKKVKVKNIIQEKKLLKKIIYMNWFTHTICSDNVNVKIQSKDNTVYVPICQDLDKNAYYLHFYKFSDLFNIPILINDNFINLTPTKELGYLFGLYLGYGEIIENKLQFTIGPNENIAINIKNSLKKLFNSESFISQDENTNYIIESNDNYLIELFSEFGDLSIRKLPFKYLAKDYEYMEYLLIGLTEYNNIEQYSQVITMSVDIAELATIISFYLELPITFIDSDENVYIVRFYHKDINLPVKTEDIQKECECCSIELEEGEDKCVINGLMVTTTTI